MPPLDLESVVNAKLAAFSHSPAFPWVLAALIVLAILAVASADSRPSARELLATERRKVRDLEAALGWNVRNVQGVSALTQELKDAWRSRARWQRKAADLERDLATDRQALMETRRALEAALEREDNSRHQAIAAWDMTERARTWARRWKAEAKVLWLPWWRRGENRARLTRWVKGGVQ